MKQTFIIDQKIFLNQLAALQPICTRRTTVEATTMILMHVGHRELVIKSTDLEISLQSSCPLIESHITEPISCLVSGKRIFDIVKELEGAITCTFEHQQLSIEAGEVKIALNTKDAQEFPPFPERIENILSIDSSLLGGLIERVAFMIPQNNAQQALNGVLCELGPEGLSMTTTDGHCLAQSKTEKISLPVPHTWLLPRRAVFEIKKLLETSAQQSLFIGTCGSQVVFSSESFNFFTKLIADQFPAYRQIMDRADYRKSTVERVTFVKALRRAASLLSGQFLAAKFTFSDRNIQINIQNREVGTLQESLGITGDLPAPLEIRFYPPYLLSGAQIIQDERINFYLKNGQKPIMYQSTSDGIDMLYLVMPVSPQTQST